MKRILAFLIILVTVFSLSAAPSAGRIGIQIDQMVHLSNDKHPVEAQEIVLSIAGANYFGESRIFGIGYTAGYGFAFDGLTSFNPIHLNASALVRFSLSDWAAVEPRIGLDDTIYIFNDIVSNEFGFSVGTAYRSQMRAAMRLTVPSAACCRCSKASLRLHRSRRMMSARSVPPSPIPKSYQRFFW